MVPILHSLHSITNVQETSVLGSNCCTENMGAGVRGEPSFTCYTALPTNNSVRNFSAMNPWLKASVSQYKIQLNKNFIATYDEGLRVDLKRHFWTWLCPTILCDKGQGC